MAKFSFAELAEDAGAATGNFAKKAATAGANFACGLYKDYPGPILANPGSKFLGGLWDTLCAGRPAGLPIAPVPAFTGGQCIGETYNVDADRTYGDNIYFDTIRVSFPGEAYGPIRGIKTVNGNHFLIHSDSVGNLKETNFGSGGSFVYKISSVSREDGQVDNCGDPGADYPEAQIPINRLTGSTTIVQNDGASITLPIVYTPISGSLPINVDVGGVPIKFDFDGAEVGENAQLAGIDELIARLADLDAALDRLEQKELARSEKEKNSLIRAEDLEEELADEDPNKEGIERLAGVMLEVTTIPQNAKQQFGIGGPNLIYAGWLEFKKGTFCFPRERIQFTKNIYAAPLDADGFAYTLYIGFEGRNTVIKFKPNQEEI